MTENFYHFSGNTIFHGIAGNPEGFTFAKARKLADDSEKISELKIRLTGYYINGLHEMTNPFTLAILTCVGLEVLGQVIIGFDPKGETKEENTIKIYEMLDPKMKAPLSKEFTW